MNAVSKLGAAPVGRDPPAAARRRPRLLPAVLAACLLSGTVPGAERRVRVTGPSYGVHVDSGAQADLDAARTAMEAGDTAEALTLVQRLINRAAARMVMWGADTCIPAQMAGTRLLESLPPASRQAYVAHIEPLARGMASRLDAVDLAGWSNVADRFFVCAAGRAAAARAAGLAMDQGDMVAAAYWLNRLLAAEPDGSEAPRWRQALRAAQRALDKDAVRISPGRSLPGDGGNGGGGKTAATMPGPGAWSVCWSSDDGTEAFLDGSTIGIQVPAQRRRRLRSQWAAGKRFPAVEPALDGGRIFVRYFQRLVCHDAASGRVMWTVPERSSPRDDWPQSFFSNESGGFDADQEPFENRLGRACATAGGSVLLVEDVLAGHREDVFTVVKGPGGRFVQGPRKPDRGNTLAAVDQATGRVLWRRGRDADDALLAKVRFSSVPLVVHGRVLVTGQDDRDNYLFAFDAATGKLRWQTRLETVPQRGLPPMTPSALCAVGSDVFVASGYGTVSALRQHDGVRLWLYAYGQKVVYRMGPAGAYMAADGWQETALLPLGDDLLILPRDSRSMIAVSRVEGRRRYSTAVDVAGYCLGLTKDGHVLCAEDRLVASYDGGTGALRWRAEAAYSGRPALDGGTLYVPCTDRVLSLDAATGARLQTIRVDRTDRLPLGSLTAAAGEYMVETGFERTRRFETWPVFRARVERAATASPTVSNLLARARAYAAAGQWDRVAGDVRGVLRDGPDPVLLREVSTLGVRALLTLSAKDPDPGGDAISEALRLAAGTPLTNCVLLARADRLAAAGRRAEAMDLYVALARAGGGQACFPEPGDDDLQVTVAAAAEQGCVRLARDPAAAEDPVFQRRLEDLAPPPNGSVAELERAARLLLGTPRGWQRLLRARKALERAGEDARADLLVCLWRDLAGPPWAQEARGLLGAAPRAAAPPLPWKQDWARPMKTPFVIAWKEGDGEPATWNRVPVVSDARRCVSLYDAVRGEPCWELELPEPCTALYYHRGTSVMREGRIGEAVAVHGGIAVLGTGGSVWFCDLYKGRKLWSLEKHPGLLPRGEQVALGSGVAAVLSPVPGEPVWRLSVYDLRDGAVRWRRRVERDLLGEVYIDGGRLYLFKVSGRTWRTFDTRTGACLASVMLPYAGRLAGLDAGQAFFEWMPTAGGNRLACLDLRSGDWAWEIEPGAPVMQLADVDADRVISTEGYLVSCRRVVMRLRHSGEAGWTWTAPERETVCYVDVCGAAQARWLQVITQPARGEAPSGFACRAYRLNLETGEPQRSTEIPRLDPHLALRLRRGWPARIDEAVWPLVTAADKLGRSWSLHVYAKRDERRLARYTLPAYGGMPYGLAETHLCGGRLLVALDKGLVAFVGQAPDRGSPPAPDR